MLVKMPRPAKAASAAAALLLVASFAVVFAAEAPDDHAVVGRWSLTSEAGGGVWAFQPGGKLVVTGPGEISSEGTWTAAAAEREFDASLDYAAAGQRLDVQGEVSGDLLRIAVHVVATPAQRPEDNDPWPAEARLIGERFGMVAQPTPSPSAAPLECARPQWVGDEVDWDRCDEGVTPL